MVRTCFWRGRLNVNNFNIFFLVKNVITVIIVIIHVPRPADHYPATAAKWRCPQCRLAIGNRVWRQKRACTHFDATTHLFQPDPRWRRRWRHTVLTTISKNISNGERGQRFSRVVEWRLHISEVLERINCWSVWWRPELTDDSWQSMTEQYRTSQEMRILPQTLILLVLIHRSTVVQMGRHTWHDCRWLGVSTSICVCSIEATPPIIFSVLTKRTVWMLPNDSVWFTHRAWLIRYWRKTGRLLCLYSAGLFIASSDNNQPMYARDLTPLYLCQTVRSRCTLVGLYYVNHTVLLTLSNGSTMPKSAVCRWRQH